MADIITHSKTREQWPRQAPGRKHATIPRTLYRVLGLWRLSPSP